MAGTNTIFIRMDTELKAVSYQDGTNIYSAISRGFELSSLKSEISSLNSEISSLNSRLAGEKVKVGRRRSLQRIKDLETDKAHLNEDLNACKKLLRAARLNPETIPPDNSLLQFQLYTSDFVEISWSKPLEEDVIKEAANVETPLLKM